MLWPCIRKACGHRVQQIPLIACPGAPAIIATCKTSICHQEVAAMSDKFEPFRAKMEKAGLLKAAIDAFRLNYEQLVGGATGMASATLRSCRSPVDQEACLTGCARPSGA